MSESSTPTIPTELVDHILGFLHSDGDYDTLETCSDIFPQLVDRHLYSRITIVTDKPFLDQGTHAVDPSGFSRILIHRPHVANYVRLVRIIILPGIGSLRLESQAISSILSNLFQIESIVLSSYYSLSWRSVDPMFRTAFQNSIRLPSVKEVDLSGLLFFPLDIFDGCKSLRRLVLFSQCTAREAVSESMPLICSLGVQTQTDPKTMTRIVSWMKSSTLHSLSLRMDDPLDLPRFRTLIEACSATLVNIELDHSFCGELCFFFFNGRSLMENLVSQYPTDPIFPGIHLPLLERIIIKSRIEVQDPIEICNSSLPLLTPFLFSLQTTRPIRLHAHLKFIILHRLPSLGFDWSDVAAFLVLPIFHHPIELSIKTRSVSLARIIFSLKQNFELNRMHDTGKLVII